MSVSAQIEIAASPEEVRRVLLDFPNWPKFGDDFLRSATLLPSQDPNVIPGEKGSKIIVDFKGLIKANLLVVENAPTVFSWYGDIYCLFSGTHSFKFLPSEITPGHTTFVNQEVFGKMFWGLYVVGVMRPKPDFERFCGCVKRRVEEVVAAEKKLGGL